MEKENIIQGRRVSEADINLINHLLVENPTWHRSRLSRELCALWDWRTANGRLKDMACRTLLLKLEDKGTVTLPPRQRSAVINRCRNRTIISVCHSTDNIHCTLSTVAPVQITTLPNGHSDTDLYRCLLTHYHYLGYKNSVGENLKYLVRDRHQRPLACLLFGSAAWKTGPRDAFIGWNPQTRKRNLHLITNNTRFLILPWVKVPCLASHVLSRVAKRVRFDWVEKYGHPIHLLETFVDRGCFQGTCYRAANWIPVGQTRGRGRNDPYHNRKASVKDIYLFPLTKAFRQELTYGS